MSVDIVAVDRIANILQHHRPSVVSTRPPPVSSDADEWRAACPGCGWKSPDDLELPMREAARAAYLHAAEAVLRDLRSEAVA